jgi:hypothetical protein
MRNELALCGKVQELPISMPYTLFANFAIELEGILSHHPVFQKAEIFWRLPKESKIIERFCEGASATCTSGCASRGFWHAFGDHGIS